MKVRLFVDECSEWVSKEDEVVIFETMNTKEIELPRVPNIGENFSYNSKDYGIESRVVVVDTVFEESDNSVVFFVSLEDCYIVEHFKEESK